MVFLTGFLVLVGMLFMIIPDALEIHTLMRDNRPIVTQNKVEIVMATAKKKTTTTKKAPVKKKPATRKAPVKKPTTVTQTRSTRSAKKSTFLTMTPTAETVYWIVLGVVVILLAVWVLNLTAKINNIYDQIDVQNATNSVIEPSSHTATKHNDTKK